MIALLQRVSRASVTVAGQEIAAIGRGLLVLAAIERRDGPVQAARLAERLLAYRVFPDPAGHMNLSVGDIAGEVLLVPQFTLAASTDQGNRPGFDLAAPPEQGQQLFDALVTAARQQSPRIQTGQFGANMDVSLVNQGPVTFWLRVAPPGAGV